jgi:hypothetical protein
MGRRRLAGALGCGLVALTAFGGAHWGLSVIFPYRYLNASSDAFRASSQGISDVAFRLADEHIRRGPRANEGANPVLRWQDAVPTTWRTVTSGPRREWSGRRGGLTGNDAGAPAVPMSGDLEI